MTGTQAAILPTVFEKQTGRLHHQMERPGVFGSSGN
jgi:hypothetical protein